MQDINVVYLGVVSGVNLREEIGPEKIDQKKTYVAVAVERKDGKPIEDELEFVVSPFIKGIKPMDFNVYAMGASCTVKIVDGVDYYLLECDDIEIFADRGIYLAVMDSPNMGQGYRFDKKTGEITRNKEFEGLNLLFEVELDKSKADSKVAQEYVDEVIYGGNNSDEDIGRTYLEFEGYNDLKNPQEVIRQAKQIKGSEKNLTPNKNGMIKYVTDEINLETSAKAVKEKGIDTVLLYGEGEEDEILTFTYENGKYIGRLYICSQSITRKAENK